MSLHIVNKQISIPATPGQVWEALTNPNLTKKYFFNSEVHSDWKQGHPITFKGKMFFIFSFEMKGTILEIIPQKLLKYNLKNAKSDSTSTVTETLSYNNGITTMTVTDDVGEGEGAEKRYKRSVKGWDKILSGLQDLLEGN